MAKTDERWNLIKSVFDAASPLPAAQRAGVIDAAGLDAAAFEEVQSLLKHYDAATADAAFLEQPAAASAEAASAARIGQRLGAWEIVRAIGAGGMGEVFEARRADGSYEGRAAVKLLKRGMDSAAVLQRFAQERQALARLTHPHIARLLDAGASDEGLPLLRAGVRRRPAHRRRRARPGAGRAAAPVPAAGRRGGARAPQPARASRT